MTPPSLPVSPAIDGRRGSVMKGLGAAAVTLGGSVFVGGLTSFAQTVLPDALHPFANSASGWTMLAFPLVWATRARLVLGTVLGVIALVGLVEGYAIVSNLRGFYYSYTGIFAIVGLVAGPVLGFAAALTRHGLGSTRRGPWRILGITPLSAVLIGDGLFGLRYVRETTGTFYWVLVLVLGVGFLVLANLRQRPGALSTVVSVVVTALGALTFLGAYTSVLS